MRHLSRVCIAGLDVQKATRKPSGNVRRLASIISGTGLISLRHTVSNGQGQWRLIVRNSLSQSRRQDLSPRWLAGRDPNRYREKTYASTADRSNGAKRCQGSIWRASCCGCEKLLARPVHQQSFASYGSQVQFAKRPDKLGIFSRSVRTHALPSQAKQSCFAHRF